MSMCPATAKYNLIRTLKLHIELLQCYCFADLQLAYSVFLLEFFCQNHRAFHKFGFIIASHVSFRSFLPFLARPGSLLACFINY